MSQLSRTPSSLELDYIFSQFMSSSLNEEEFCREKGIPIEWLTPKVEAFKELNESIWQGDPEPPSFEPIRLSVNVDAPSLSETEYELRLGNGKSLIVRGIPQADAVRCLLEVLED